MPRVPTGRPRGRPPKLKPGEPGYEEQQALAAQRKAEREREAEAKPAAPSGPKRDLLYFVNELKLWRDKYLAAIESGSKEIPDLRAAVAMVEMEARAFGYDFKSLADTRPADEKFMDFMESVSGSADGHAAFEVMLQTAEQDLFAMRARLLDGVQMMSKTATNVINKQEMLADREEKLKRAMRLGKGLGELLTRVMELQRMAREEFPPESLLPMEKGGWGVFFSPMTQDCKELTIRASLMLRHMTYVMRTNLTSRQAKGGSEALLDWKMHHSRIAWQHFEVWNWRRPALQGVIDTRRWKGSLVTLGPGHGKTLTAVGLLSLLIAQNPYRKVHLTHAKEDKASANLQWLGSLFDRGTPAGRRLTALYPHLKLRGKVSSTQFRLETAERSKQPTAVCAGVRSRIGGGDADIVWFDDAVDPLEREQPEERRRKKALVATWFKRLRDETGRFIVTCTLEHEDDANFDLIRKSKAKLIDMRVLKIPCGGPKGSFVSKVPFHAIWPEVIPSSRLRQEYAADPVGYAAEYMCDPSHEAAQIIRKMRFYDPASAEHVEFMRSSQKYLSIDPSVTARQHSDKTAFVYAALGDVSGTVNGQFRTERRLRIIRPEQFLCSMSDLTMRLASFVLSNPTDYVAVEVVAGFASLPDTIRNELGIDVIPCPTGNKSKEVRLRGVATLLDHSRADGKDAGGAVVEFPGVARHIGHATIIEPDPQFDWYYRQFFRFGTIKDDHALDASTQLVAHLVRCGELESGAGFITEKVREAVQRSDFQNRLAKMLDEANGVSVRKGSANDEDGSFLSQGSNSWM